MEAGSRPYADIQTSAGEMSIAIELHTRWYRIVNAKENVIIFLLLWCFIFLLLLCYRSTRAVLSSVMIVYHESEVLPSDGDNNASSTSAERKEGTGVKTSPSGGQDQMPASAVAPDGCIDESVSLPLLSS